MHIKFSEMVNPLSNYNIILSSLTQYDIAKGFSYAVYSQLNTCTHTHTYTHKQTHKQTHTHTQTHTHKHTYIHTQLHMHSHTYISPFIFHLQVWHCFMPLNQESRQFIMRHTRDGITVDLGIGESEIFRPVGLGNPSELMM